MAPWNMNVAMETQKVIDPDTPVEVFANFALKALQEEYEVDPVSFRVEVDFEDDHLDIYDIKVPEALYDQTDVTLEYEDLEITVQSPMNWEGDYEEWEETEDCEYTPNKDRILDALCDLVKEDEIPKRIRDLDLINEDLAATARVQYIIEEFENLFDKYYYQLRDIFEEDAREIALDKYYNEH